MARRPGRHHHKSTHPAPSDESGPDPAANSAAETSKPSNRSQNTIPSWPEEPTTILWPLDGKPSTTWEVSFFDHHIGRYTATTTKPVVLQTRRREKDGKLWVFGIDPMEIDKRFIEKGVTIVQAHFPPRRTVCKSGNVTLTVRGTGAIVTETNGSVTTDDSVVHSGGVDVLTVGGWLQGRDFSQLARAISGS